MESWVIEFLENTLFPMFNSIEMKQVDQGIFNDKNVYTFQLPKVYLKYESSLRKDSSLDTKEFPMIIEVYKNPISVHLKIRLTDLGMTIDHGDELLHLIQTVGANYPGVYMNIEENGKVVIESKISFQKSLNSFFGLILENIDALLINAIHFYISCVRSIGYNRPTKDVIKYPIFVNIMKGNVRYYKKEIKYFYPKWRFLKDGAKK
jgi:hypothetical protein